MEECLPQDMLEAVLEKLDRETLCTARLVSRTFCAAASANMSRLTLSRPAQAVSLERFPRLGVVRVTHGRPAELDPRLRAVITHLMVSQDPGCVRMTLPDLPGMPKLRELDIDVKAYMDGAEVLHRLTSLEVLRIGDCAPSVATTIPMTTWLTSLSIGLVTGPDEGGESADFSWLQHATNLRKLQALQISISHEALPLIGNLTGLTGLTWLGIDPQRWYPVVETYSIAPLSRLTRLRSLDIRPLISDSNLAIACSLGSGSLAKLCLRVSWDASVDCGRLLARQTALERLAIHGAQVYNLRHMGALRMALLQSLELSCLDIADAEGLDVLQRATSLTKLLIAAVTKQSDERLSWTLGRLTQLRCLHLGHHADKPGATKLNLRLALGPLTALTKLRISEVRLDNIDVQALLRLTGLQMLELYACNLRDDLVPKLGMLTNLRTLSLRYCGVTSLAPATNILNPLRQARGWPPVDARPI